MIIIVDTSIAIKWVVREAQSEQALSLLDDEPLVLAPDRMLPELVSVLRRKLKTGDMVEGQFFSGVQEAAGTVDRFVPSIELALDAASLSLDLDHSPYDCFFLACALGRGILVTADSAFVRKCKIRGYGNVVVDLADASDGRLAAIGAAASLDQQVLQTIDRLIPIIDRTFKSLRDAAPGLHLFGQHKITTGRDVAAGFASPAYIALDRVLSQLDPEQLTVLLALGWLGRTQYDGKDWAHLWENAKISSLADEYRSHRNYILAQTGTVSAGLSKLRAHFGIVE